MVLAKVVALLALAHVAELAPGAAQHVPELAVEVVNILVLTPTAKPNRGGQRMSMLPLSATL